MDVKTVDETGLSVKSIFTYLFISAALVAVILFPSKIVPGYGHVVSTILALSLIVMILRAALGSLLAFDRPDAPELPADEELPTVSVLIPAYNEEPVLPGTIEACKNVDYPAEKLEVVLCYEADSSDRTGEICREAADGDERFVAIERDEPGGGKAKATNYAIKHATGDIFASIDADHRFRPDAIRRAVGWFLEDEDVWCVKGRCYGDNPTDSLLALHATVERHIAEVADLFAREALNGFTIFGGGQAFFRKEVFQELGMFDEDILVEDIDMSSKIHTAGKKLRVDPSVITFEENPPTLSAWWSQRHRWARGWMQVANRYLTELPKDRSLTNREKIDAVFTFALAVLPALLILAIPIPFTQWLTPDVPMTYLPYDWLMLLLIPVSPALVAWPIYIQDRADGLTHHWSEWLAPFTLWIYFGLQAAVFVTAFIDEYILGKASVYVTTTRSESAR
ncbi:MAG: glycosyltransferase family 2 protein [Halapricum sp.]